MVKDKCCPKCGSKDVGLWNSRKQIYHCHDCDNYFKLNGNVRDDLGETRQRDGSRGGWNGFTDPDDFPTDGFDGGGW